MADWLDGELGQRLYHDAVAAGPHEICGLIARHEPSGTLVCYPVTNTAPRRHDRFVMDAAEQIAVFRRIRHSGQTLVAIYHSHPRGEAIPSCHDIDGHTYPKALAVIIAPEAIAGPVVRTWHVRAGRVSEAKTTGAGAFL